MVFAPRIAIVAFKIPDYTLGSLSLGKVTHIAQPSVGFFVRF
jgi:hypothetical protein